MRHIDFENIEEKFDKTLVTKEWKQLEKDFESSSDIYLVANGGLWAIANHAADDCTRLFAKAGIKKHISNLDSQCLLTSLANDYGWNNIFISWLELKKQSGAMKKDAMVIGLSCSGGSKNVVSSCHWAKEKGYKTAMISGQDRGILEEDINQVVLNCQYFHTVEVLSLILFYDLIHSCGAECPNIKGEVIRKGMSATLSRNPLN